MKLYKIDIAELHVKYVHLQIYPSFQIITTSVNKTNIIVPPVIVMYNQRRVMYVVTHETSTVTVRCSVQFYFHN